MLLSFAMNAFRWKKVSIVKRRDIRSSLGDIDLHLNRMPSPESLVGSEEEKEKGKRRISDLEIARDREERVTSPVARSHRKLIDVWLRLPARVLTRQYKYLSSSPCAFTHSVRCIKAPIALSAHIDALILIGALRSTRNIFMADESVYAGGWINI